MKQTNKPTTQANQETVKSSSFKKQTNITLYNYIYTYIYMSEMQGGGWGKLKKQTKKQHFTSNRPHLGLQRASQSTPRLSQ